MKGTEKIIAHIRADAKDRSDAILAQAERQCALIRSDYEKQAKEVYTGKIRAGVAETQARVDGMDRIARMEAKKGILALKQQMVSESFDKACEMLADLPAKQYIAFLAKTAAEASSSKNEEMIFNARDRESIGQTVADKANRLLGDGKLTVSAETGSFAGGFILRRGRIETKCTAELLVELCRNELSSEIAGVLFE